jgi:hypothetical protein
MKKIVIFVLSAQNDCFLLTHENEFLVETVRLRLQTHSNLAHEIQTQFFLQPLFKLLLIKLTLTTKRSDIQVARLRWLLGYEFL